MYKRIRPFESLLPLHLVCHGDELSFLEPASFEEWKPAPGDVQKVAKLADMTDPVDIALMEEFCKDRPARTMYFYAAVYKFQNEDEAVEHLVKMVDKNEEAFEQREGLGRLTRIRGIVAE